MSRVDAATTNEALGILQAAGFLPSGDTVAAEVCALALETHLLPSGHTLMRQGDAGDAMYIVISGRLRAYVERDGDAEAVGEIGRGEIVGEMALLTDAPRSATVRAIRDTRVVKVPRETFERLAVASPSALMQMTRTLVARLQRVLRGSSSTPAVTAIALAPAHPGAPVAAFAERFCQELEKDGSTLWLDGDRFDDRVGQTGAAQITGEDSQNAELVNWLSGMEMAHAHVVYQADTTWSAWTQRCLRQADRILYVADAAATPGENAIASAAAAAGIQPRAELVLLQPAGIERPSGTLAWLEQIKVGMHHHVSLAEPQSWRRLHRRLTGRAVGLVLSGGAARGFAHIGVIRALEEASVAVDLIGGTSMGALMAGVYAMDWDYPTMYAHSEVLGSADRIFDRTLPLTAMMESAKVTRILQSLFGDVHIEDLWRPFFCVSSDLTHAEPILHRQGLLWEAVRCSLAIPGIFSPVLYQGNLVVDGGLMNNLPVDVMRREFEAGAVIAVNASPRKARLRSYSFGPSISGWKVLMSRANPFGKRKAVPSITGLLLRSLEVNSAYQTEHRLSKMADLFIEPAVESFNGLDWSAYPQIIAAGYEAAQAQLPGWQQSRDADW